MSKEMREQINKVKNWEQFLNKSVNEGEFGFGEFPKPKTEIWIQFMNRALKDGLISQIHYGDKRIQNIAKELANEFENMEELNRQSNKDLFLGMFYDRIPRWAWGEPTNSILMKYGLKKSYMEDFRFTTKEPLATNADTMDWFSNEHFYEVFDEDAIFIEDDGSYAEVLDGKGQKWGLHASGDGDFISHRIRFEAL